jgi:hypothetical protein
MSPKLLLIACLHFILVGCGTVLTKTPSDSNEPGQFRKPQATKVVLVILENTNADTAHDPKFPFLWRVAKEGAYLSNYYAIAHPSQPNYVALVSGSIKDVNGDSPSRLRRAHLGQKLPSWMSYAEGYPSGTCNTDPTIGPYVRRHEPFLSFADVQDDKDLCLNHVTGFDEFIATAHAHRLPSFSLVIPNLNHDAHDKPLRDADAWLEEQFGPLLDDAEFKRDVLLIVTFDENGARWPYLNHSNNTVYTVLWGSDVIPGSDVNTVYDHYDLLRTIEAIFDLSPMSTEDAKAHAIGGVWR